MSVKALQAMAPPMERTALKKALASVPANQRNKLSGVLKSMTDTIRNMGLTINWGCLFQIIPQALAAFGNPALWPAVLAAYFTCANPTGPRP